MEWEIPIPAVKGGTTRDYSVIQRAWYVKRHLTFSAATKIHGAPVGGTG